MKWFRAIIYNIIVLGEILLSPFIPKFYESYGIKGDSIFLVVITGVLILLGQVVLLIIFYISAIKDKELKDLTL